MFGVDLEEQFGYSDDLKYPYAFIVSVKPSNFTDNYFSEKKPVRNIVTEFSAAQDMMKPKIKYQTIFSHLGLRSDYIFLRVYNCTADVLAARQGESSLFWLYL